MFDLLVHAPETTEEPIDSPEFRCKIAMVQSSSSRVECSLGLDELHLRFLATSSETSAKGKTLRKVHGTSLSYRDCFSDPYSLQPHAKGAPLSAGYVQIINESLPIFLDSAVNTHLIIDGAIATVVISTTAIVCQSFSAPIAYPIAKLPDHVLSKSETYDEVTLSKDTILDHATVDAILINGYSRIPIHEPGGPLAFQGLLLVKKVKCHSFLDKTALDFAIQLLIYDPSKCLPVSHFKLSILPEAHPSINCFQALDYFQTGRAHILLISCNPGIAGGGIGVITLEGNHFRRNHGRDRSIRRQPEQAATAKRLTNAAVMRDIIERERNLTRKTPIEQRTPLLPISLQVGTPPRGGYGTLSASDKH
ncbi:hypothetical protein EDD17DRAFT_1516488 [Pisolithus thermaeus]|nr:hypothetical protein EDD17DRAFT_1516488 [Pisolithus thermaeus]